MKPKLQVESTGILQDLGGNEYAEEILVVDEDRPWLEIRLNVHEWHDAEAVFFQLSHVHIASKDVDGAKPTLALRDGEWWSEVLDAVLEHVAFTSIAFDRAAERSSGTFTYLYGWEDGILHEDEIRPAEPASRTDPAT